MNKNYDFFISYSREIYDSVVEPIINQLEYLGFCIWIDKTEVTLGTNIYKNLEIILEKSLKWYGAIVIIDSSYMQKDWCRWEAEYFVNNNVYCFPILYKITKLDLKESFSYFKNYNIATIKSERDLSLTVDKILLSYLKNLKPSFGKYEIKSKLLYSVVAYYKRSMNSLEQVLLIGEIVSQIVSNKIPEAIQNDHQLKIIINIIHYKIKKLYVDGYCTRYDSSIIRSAINKLLNQILITI